jgi:uncharacterized protein HemX
MGILVALVVGAIMLGAFQKYQEEQRQKLKKERKRAAKAEQSAAGSTAVMAAEIQRLSAIVAELQKEKGKSSTE